MEIVKLDDIDIKRLSSIYDTMDTYLSAVVSARDYGYDMAYVNSRIKAIEKAVKGTELEKNFLAARDELYELLDKGPVRDEKTLVAFLSPVNNFSEIYRLAVEVEKSLVLDTSPYIRPLALAMDTWKDIVFVIMDSQNAEIYLIASDMVEAKKKLSEDIMKHHKKGGWSQMRFQRLRQGAVHEFMKDVIENMRKMVEMRRGDIRGIILAGPGEAKKHLYDMLPGDLSTMVIDVVDTDYPLSRGKMIEMADAISEEDEEKKSNETVDRLRELIFRDGPVAYGIDDAITAAKDGRIEILVIDDETRIPGYIC